MSSALLLLSAAHMADSATRVRVGAHRLAALAASICWTGAGASACRDELEAVIAVVGRCAAVAEAEAALLDRLGRDE